MHQIKALCHISLFSITFQRPRGICFATFFQIQQIECGLRLYDIDKAATRDKLCCVRILISGQPSKQKDELGNNLPGNFSAFHM